MIAQDTGSAITGPARGDLFAGSGDAAGEIAGVVRNAADFYALRAAPRWRRRRRDEPAAEEAHRRGPDDLDQVARTAKPLKGKPPLPSTNRKPTILSLDEALAGAEASGTPRRGAAAAGAARPSQASIASTSRPRQARQGPAADRGPRRSARHDARARRIRCCCRSCSRAHASGLRYVLVITGKGASFGSEGVLKRAVPAWLSTPPFRALVAATIDAARQHGGAGALYMRLRRTSAPA